MMIKSYSLFLDRRQIIQWLTVAGVFLPNAFASMVFSSVFEFGAILLGVILVAKHKKRLYINRDLIFIFILLLMYQLILIAWIHYPFDRFINQYIMLLLFFIGYSILFDYNQNDIQKLFQKYLKLSFYVSLLAILQFIIYLLFSFNICQIFTAQTLGQESFTVGGIFLRVNGIVMEPGLLSTLLTPAVAYYIFTFKSCNKKRALLTLSALLLTFSAAGYVVLCLILIYQLLFRNISRIKLVMWPTTFLLCIFSIYKVGSTEISDGNFLSGIREKVDQSIDGLQQLRPEMIERLNISSYATLINLYVAQNAPARLTGTGLGNHSYNYDKVYVSNHPNYGLNKYDGYSLLTRLYSETGWIGLILFFIFVVRNFNRHNLINTSVIFLIITFMMRGGHYTLNGSVFFLFMYHYTSKLKINDEIKNNYNICR